jgi:hypothetical protein
MKFTTYIPATDKRLEILGSVIGQLSDGIWENTRSMEKYWKNLDYGKDVNGYIYIEDCCGVCADPVDFFANKIKQIIKIEIEDGSHSGLVWDRGCSISPYYIHGNVTVGDCYELYELLKGRNTSKYRYAKLEPYKVELEFDGVCISVKVDATNELAAKRKAIEYVASKFKATAVKL